MSEGVGQVDTSKNQWAPFQDTNCLKCRRNCLWSNRGTMFSAKLEMGTSFLRFPINAIMISSSSPPSSSWLVNKSWSSKLLRSEMQAAIAVITVAKSLGDRALENLKSFNYLKHFTDFHIFSLFPDLFILIHTFFTLFLNISKEK